MCTYGAAHGQDGFINFELPGSPEEVGTVYQAALVGQGWEIASREAGGTVWTMRDGAGPTYVVGVGRADGQRGVAAVTVSYSGP